MAIKEKVLADFVTEVQNPEPDSVWKIYVDGSSTRQGSGISILLISPQEEWVQLSVRLEYRATNNEVEYEALITDLQAARHVGAGKVLIYSDSQLAAQQLTGAFEISNTQLKLYAEAFEKLKASFQEVVIQKIPRAENQAADELAKLASSLSPIVITQPIKQVSFVAHVDQIEGLTFSSD
ncbi:14.7 kDa ribonuclease H-like protein [Zingiber officinale]|uniref:14.7 kDa ribonuclease H-like protein n=1 Tax=Zingiber officinale TaxID=94328 RepID=UPI001C4AC415|nr:14.7 kDa ribonuclease H-like protein [Zingiber officinale]